MANPEEIKDKFYKDLENIIEGAPEKNKLFVLEDFNARVGTDYKTWESHWKEWGWKCNSNGPLLLKTCASQDLLITNTVYHLPNRNKTSWMHPRSKHWHLIDYINVGRRDRQDVIVTKAMSADCWTDQTHPFKAQHAYPAQAAPKRDNNEYVAQCQQVRMTLHATEP